MKNIITIFLLALCVSSVAQEAGLNKKQFDRYWQVESESPDYRVTFLGDTAEITAPLGLTLWRKEKFRAPVELEYDACIVMEDEGDRLSDLNCFWMASDPAAPDNIFKRQDWRGGVFNNCYSLQLYYLGYGGNSNTTTRFRRYDGKPEAVEDTAARPQILREYTDEAHLLKPNHWYHIKISCQGDRTCYYIDGERLVDFREAEPLTEGWFGLRTTQARLRVANFHYTSLESELTSVPLHWIGETPQCDKGVSFGVPFDEGWLQPDGKLSLSTASGEDLQTDQWPLAYWPDGSVKWLGLAAVVPGGTDSLFLAKTLKEKGQKNAETKLKECRDEGETIIGTGKLTAYIPQEGSALVDSLVLDGVTVGRNLRLVCSTQSEPVLDGTESVSFENYESALKSVTVERQGDVRACVRLEGVHRASSGREWLPFVVRLYFYEGSDRVEMVHSIVFDGDQDKDFIRSLGVRMDVPMREALYNRHVAFSCADGGVWSEPVQPLVGRRVIALPTAAEGEPSIQQKQMMGQRIPPYEDFDEKGRMLLDNWASWDAYRLSQLSPDAFSIRKRTHDTNPWIGTFSGTRSGGYAFAGDVSGGMGVALHDFWQSFPSTIEITGTRSEAATLTVWLWSPEAEPMDLRHYDNVAHDLEASYEDVQEGMSTPYGIAKTSTLTLLPLAGYSGKESFALDAAETTSSSRLMPTPQYLHDRRAFGIWSLPDRSNAQRSQVEDRLTAYVSFYHNAIEQNKWYGFWNYGDVMHSYDPVRHTWRYDVGGYAWDNTELASNMWLWYNFLRTGEPYIWRMAEAMTRHTTETDVYHLGPNAGLGSRHNVSHWGCGAKEARISQAAWNRFYYYLTTDERSGDLMHEVADNDQMLYTIDPMRLAEPRELYPCTAPARLRIGPDWLAYAGNWMTEWERTQDTKYKDKIVTGMKSIASLPSRIFTGPLALGYDPATGVITSECDPTLQQTNHLMPIMGGFEVMNEMMRMLPLPEWQETWLDYAANYKRKALEINHNRFRISRLQAYASYHLRDPQLAREAWHDLFNQLETAPAPPFFISTVLPPEVPAPLDECNGISTNDAAIWSLDAIYMQEVIPLDQDY
ncbi:MAG: DUF6250 domain-containing protein [Prevotellaceae bacterium]|nr:DUF6250 domain-containing protein [Prevotellaceae bacterium]